MSETNIQEKVKGAVKSAELAQNLPGVVVSLTDSSGNETQRTQTDNNGCWEIARPGTGETLTFSKPGFVTKTIRANPVPELVRLLDDRLIGYQDKLWFVPGEVVSVYVYAPVNYHATLYRHGINKEPVQVLKDLVASEQQVPDGYFVDEGLSWEESFRYTIPTNAKPGLYSLMLEAPGQQAFAIPMTVSTPMSMPMESAAGKLLVLASTTTWQAYNIWGGRSRYLNFESSSEAGEKTAQSTYVAILMMPLVRLTARLVKKLLPKFLILLIRKYFNTRPENLAPWMLKRLSIRRPVTNCSLEAEKWSEPFINHLAAGEWRVLAWLESKGYDYDIISGWELQNNPEFVGQHKALIISTHCEYWSCRMFKNVKHAHEDNGLWVINLAGNSMYREIQHFDDGSLHLVSGPFFKSCSDESRLIGVRFTESDFGTCAPYQALDIKHWIFEGTGIGETNRVFGEHSLNQGIEAEPGNSLPDPGRPAQGQGLSGNGASGWETDKLSQTAPKDFHLVAKGMNRNGGAEMVVREPSGNRGGVFSASSIVFGGALSIDPVCSRIVENVLKKCLR